jgi:hypothetical protein
MFFRCDFEELGGCQGHLVGFAAGGEYELFMTGLAFLAMLMCL